MKKLLRILKHRWLDEADAKRAVPPAMAKRLEARIAASEQRHSGEIRIIVEGGLPRRYLWRGASPRHRAEALFGKYGLWNTEHRNGVLIYLLLADHAIEVVADRGLNDKVSTAEWSAMVKRLGAALKEKDFETGLTNALAEVSALQMQHFALLGVNSGNANELSNLLIWR